jgi:hypothetical protein
MSRSMPSHLLSILAFVSFLVSTTACTVGAPVSLGDAGTSRDGAATDARPPVDAGPILTPEERFASACTRWHYWTEGNSTACDDCRTANCAGLAIAAELHAHECPGEFECVQDGCYPDGTAASIECDCVLPCFTVSVCRNLWIDAMECVAQHCSEACGERPPD